MLENINNDDESEYLRSQGIIKEEIKVKENEFENYLKTQQRNLFRDNNRNKINLMKGTFFSNKNNNILNNTFQSSFIPSTKSYFYQRSTLNTFNDTPNNIYNNTTNQISIDEKILKVNENKKKLIFQNNLETSEKFYQKEKKLHDHMENMEKEKLTIAMKNNKKNYMKRLKLKIFGIVNKNSKKICHEFESKVTGLNIKILDYLQGKTNLNNTLSYHKKFRYDKYDNGEAHNRYKTILDIDCLKQDDIEHLNILRKKLSSREKKSINEDPAYFFQGNIKSIEFKPLSLTKRLIQEENNKNYFRECNKKKKESSLNFEFQNYDNESIYKKSKEMKFNYNNKNNICSTLKIICDDINKTVYDDRTKNLIIGEKNISKEKHNKIMNKMKDELRMKGFKTMTQEKRDFKNKLIEDYRFSNFLNEVTIKKNKNIVKNNNNKKKGKSTEETLVGQVGHSFNYKNFTKQDMDIVNYYKDRIKNIIK